MLYTQSPLQSCGGVSPLGWCDGCHRTTAPVSSPHTSYSWRGERIIEPIKWIISLYYSQWYLKPPYSRSRVLWFWEPLLKERWQTEPWRKRDRGWPSKNLALLSKWHIFGRAESQADRFLIVFHSSAQFTEQRLSKAVSHIYCATPAMQKARLSCGRQSHQRCSCAIGGKETCLEVRQCSSC